MIKVHIPHNFCRGIKKRIFIPLFKFHWREPSINWRILWELCLCLLSKNFMKAMGRALCHLLRFAQNRADLAEAWCVLSFETSYLPHFVVALWRLLNIHLSDQDKKTGSVNLIEVRPSLEWLHEKFIEGELKNIMNQRQL